METLISVLLVALCVFIIIKVAKTVIKIIAFCAIVLIVCIYFNILPASILSAIGL
ncbi:hypothetical protein [Clostridium sp. B9]|uniref:hypothetical protein n=1 Tax=Clostridium sp. B9 TaxID=3423224 RepID=UPI003D2F2642